MGPEFSDLLKDLPRGQHAEHLGQQPANYFENPAHIAATQSLKFEHKLNAESKIFLGLVGGRVHVGERSADGRVQRWIEGGQPIGVADDRHHFLLAGSRGGKGRSVLTTNLITLPAATSVLVLDPKGDLAAMTAKYRNLGLKQKVAVTDPFNCSGANTTAYRASFNPIDMVSRSNSSTLTANAMLVADSLVIENESSKDPHWDDSGRAWISGLVAHVATHESYAGNRDLVTVWQLASEASEGAVEGSDRYPLELEMLQSDAASGFVRAAAQSFYSRQGGEFSGVASNARRHLNFIGVEAIQNVLRGPSSVDPRELKNGSLTWYVTSPAMRANLMRGFQRMVVQLTLAAFEEETNAVGNQSVFMLDEFQSLGKLRALETAIAQFAGLGAKLMIVLQDLSQIKANYPRSWQTFIGNAGTLQSFAANDDETLSYLSKRLGDAQVATQSSNQPGRSQSIREAATGANWAIGNKPLMTPSEIELFFARDDPKLRQLVLRPGYRPMILQRAFYDKSEYFAGRFSQQ